MTTGELELFCRILPKYADYLEKNPKSLLAKILGVFTIRQENTFPVVVMLMENTLRLLKKDGLTKVYDLKGSRVDRTSPEDSGTHKDNNFIKKI